MVVGFTAIVGCGNQEARQAGQTLEPLQLGELKVHEYDDMGFSIAYPSDWIEGGVDSEIGCLIYSPVQCLGEDLVITVSSPDQFDNADLQYVADFLKDSLLQKYNESPLSEQSSIINGIPVIELIYSIDNITGSEQLQIYLLFLSKDESMIAFTISYCHPDCWDYYVDAVYTITATYQFLD